jgi:hypothetical protein
MYLRSPCVVVCTLIQTVVFEVFKPALNKSVICPEVSLVYRLRYVMLKLGSQESSESPLDFEVSCFFSLRSWPHLGDSELAILLQNHYFL